MLRRVFLLKSWSFYTWLFTLSFAPRWTVQPKNPELHTFIFFGDSKSYDHYVENKHLYFDLKGLEALYREFSETEKLITTATKDEAQVSHTMHRFKDLKAAEEWFLRARPFLNFNFLHSPNLGFTVKLLTSEKSEFLG